MKTHAELTYRKGIDREGRVTLGERTVVGRSEHCDITLGDRGVSKEHCEIRPVGSSWVIRDLGSKNGTFVNGRQIARELWLRDGDRISVGGTQLVFHALGNAVSEVVKLDASPPGDDSRICGVIAGRGDEFPPADAREGDDLKKDYERLRLAFDIYRDLTSFVDQDGLLDRILDRTLDLLPAENAAILLNDGEGKPVPVAARRAGDRGTGRIVISTTILDKVLKAGEALLTADALHDDRLAGAQSIVARGIRSAMCVPITGRAGVLGAIHLEASDRRDAYTAKDLAVLASIAAQAGLAIENARLSRSMAEEMLTRERLSRYLSPVLVERVVSRQAELSLEGALRKASIMFADIRDFTRITGEAEPHEVVELLNAVFGIAADTVFVHNGVLDKFIGDAVMALWGGAEVRPDDASSAVRAALDMQREIAKFSEAEVRAGRRPVSIGIGIDTGGVVVGDMGSGRRMEFTAVGHAVNLASRLCARASGGEVLVTEATARETGDEFTLTRLPPVTVKGHDLPVSVFSVAPGEKR